VIQWLKNQVEIDALSVRSAPSLHAAAAAHTSSRAPRVRRIGIGRAHDEPGLNPRRA